jgi:C1A family cysteine protease
MGNYFGKYIVEDINDVKKLLGWIKDEFDHRDQWASFTVPIKPEYDLRDDFDLPAIYNQGTLGSCTGNGIAFCYQFEEMKQHNNNEFKPSRLFIYYNERVMEGTVDQDSGAQIRDGIKSINTEGVCDEKNWPYDITKFTDKPTKECYDQGIECHSVKYERVEQSLDQLKGCIESGYPVVFGFTVFESFMSKSVAYSGVMPMPKKGEQILGGHCVVLVGFDDQCETFTVRNSWGESWGDNGYFTMPYDFVRNSHMCSDFWNIETVSVD